MVKKISVLILLLFCTCLQSCVKKESKELQQTGALTKLQGTLMKMGEKLQQNVSFAEITAEFPEDFVVMSGRLIHYQGTGEKVIIPEGISIIGKGAFSGNKTITSVQLPEGLVTIETSAFSGCSNLKEVVVPDTLRAIRESAFWQCVSLDNIDLHAVKSLYRTAFYGCKNLRVVDLGLIEELGEGVFEATGVQEVIGMGNIKKAGNGILMDTPIYEKYLAEEEEFFICGALLVSGQNAEGDIKVPEGIRVILGRAFEGNDQIASVAFPDTVLEIGNDAFRDCDSLEKVDMTDSVVRLGSGAFSGCGKLQQIRLSKKLGQIPERCFSGCDIREITVPQGCTLADGAFFYYGTKERKLTFPPDAKNLGNLFQHIDDENFDMGEYCFYTTDLSEDIFLVRMAKERGWKLEALQLETTELTMHVGEEYVLRFNSGADALWGLNDDTVICLGDGEHFGEQKLMALKEGIAVVTAVIYGKEYVCTVTVVQ